METPPHFILPKELAKNPHGALTLGNANPAPSAPYKNHPQKLFWSKFWIKLLHEENQIVPSGATVNAIKMKMSQMSVFRTLSKRPCVFQRRSAATLFSNTGFKEQFLKANFVFSQTQTLDDTQETLKIVIIYLS